MSTGLPLLPPRQDHLPRKLVAWYESVATRPFAWGAGDCWTLVREAVAVMTGLAAAPSLGVAAYDDALGAVRALTAAVATHGSVGDTLVAAGLRGPLRPVYAQAGDIVVWPSADDDPVPVFGVVVGTHVVSADHDRGVFAEPMHGLYADTTATLYRVP